jgi:hypothetical protein
MAFADLVTAEADFGPQWAYLVSVAGEDDPESLFIDQARAALLRDLQVALNKRPGDEEDMDWIDELTALQEPRLVHALALKQIAMVYESKQKGEESIAFVMWQKYKAEYENARAGFAGLTKRQGSTRVRSVGNYR